MIVSSAFAGKSYAVLGLARSGLATVEALLASGAEVMAWDSQEEVREQVRTSLPGVRIADPLIASLKGLAGVIVSPGVPLNRHPIAGRAREAKVPLIGDVELFAQARAELPPHKVVGITGTNGKSTVTALVHHILRSGGIPTSMGGNIGLPILSQDPLPQGGVYVLELSSYQIDLTQSLDCDVGVLLNITPDHLDRYDSFKAYAASKRRLFEMQSEAGIGIFNYDDEEVWQQLDRLDMGEWSYRGELREVRPSEWTAKGSFQLSVSPDGLSSLRFTQSSWPALQGPHNAENVDVAVEVALTLDVAPRVIRRALQTYPGLPHRMERVAEKKGVLFVNDSKATNPTSAAPALAAYPAVHWILGGRPKSDDLDPCEPFLDHVRAAYTIGEAGPMFAELLKPKVAVKECGMLLTAVGEAAEAARPGEVVLLSPACASFDQFRDYEARGDAFRAAVEAL
jgi:UDP-N-acetylmuramoylalanine--D-glutamate ligase